MTNAGKFKGIFGIYASEVWAKSEKEFLKWLNEDVPETNIGDMISRQAAIDELHTYFKDGFEQDRWWNSTHVLKAIRGVPSAQRKGKWIPVSSGLLPKAECGESEDVLCQLENMRRIVLYFDGSNWCYPSGELYIGVNYENGWSNKVVAWMPLPKLWEGEEDEAD